MDIQLYPCLDPQDISNSCATIPFSIPCINAKYNQSMLNWVFKNMVLKNNAWVSADIYTDFNKYINMCPGTLIIHRSCNSIMPIEQSKLFLNFFPGKDNKLISLIGDEASDVLSHI